MQPFDLKFLSPAILHISLGMLLVVPLQAQEKEESRGRLPDGRAFQTDVEGAQLIDYIAELEQSVEELNRQTISLEDENTNLRAQVQRLSAGHSDQVAEKNLLPAPIPQPQFSGSSFYSPAEAGPAIETQNCEENLKRIEQLQRELETVKLETVKLDTVKQDTVKQDNVSLARGPGEAGSSQGERESQAQPRDTSEDLRAQIRIQERELLKARLERDRLQAIVQQGSFISPASAVLENIVPHSNLEEARAHLAPALPIGTPKALESIKSRMQQDLEAVLSKKDERDMLFAKYIKDRQGVTLSPSSLQARSGRQLSELGAALKKAETIRELASLRLDLEEIQKQMGDDLALIERMSKLSPR